MRRQKRSTMWPRWFAMMFFVAGVGVLFGPPTQPSWFVSSWAIISAILAWSHANMEEAMKDNWEFVDDLLSRFNKLADVIHEEKEK